MLLTLIDHTPARRRSPYVPAIAGFLGLAVAMGVGRFAFTPILPLMQAEAGITVADGAWLAAANYVGYLVGALAALGLRGRSVLFIRIGLVATAAVTFGMAATEHMSAWLVLRFLAGVASAFLLVFVSAWSLERIAAAGWPLLSGVVFSGVGSGIFAVGAVCLALERVHAHFSDVWIVVALLSALLGMAAWPFYWSGVAQAVSSRLSEEHDGNHVTTPWRLVLSYGLFGFGYIVPATFLPVMVRRTFIHGAALDISWLVFGLAACISTIVAARMRSRVSALDVWRSAQGVMAIGVALPAFVTAPAALIVAALCVGGTFMVVTMAGMHTANELGGAGARRLMATMTAAFATGQLVGPITVPYLSRPGGDFSIVLGLAAAALVVGAGLLPSRSTRHEALSQQSLAVRSPRARCRP